MPIDDLSDVLAPSPKRSLSDDVAERLRKAIWSGRLAPDERLREEVLADSLGVSRGPIREALSQLEREGLVIKQPNRGAVVARLSPEDLNEVYSLRLAIERLAVQQAVQNAEAKHFRQMQDVINQMATGQLTELHAATLDVQFHEIVYEAARHKRLYDCWSNLKPQIYVFLLSRNVANPDYRALAVQSHQILLDAITERNEPLAVERIEWHLKSAYERIEKIYVPRPDDSDRAKAGKVTNADSPSGEG
jgi:DNA-binding GntR family transcriptional regulator